MPGFLFSNFSQLPILRDDVSCNTISKEAVIYGYNVKVNTINKFVNDKAFFIDGNYLIICEGVLLNKTALLNKYNVKAVNELIIKMYEKCGNTFFDEFRGSFSGLLLDHKRNRLIAYTNHYGDNTIFYYFRDNNLIIGSRINYITDTLKENNIAYSFNEDAALDMLTYGYMSDSKSWVNEITRLLPGHYLIVDGCENEKKEFKDIIYYQITNDKYDLGNLSDTEIIEELDRRFTEAVRAEYEKDKEYGYRSLTQISGGLDSRMNLFSAHKLGYDNILCMTFGQSNCLDEKIAKRITADLQIELLLWSLDSAKHLMNIDKYVKINSGLALYSGVGAEFEILSALNSDKFGLVHTGQVGDVVFGSFLSSVSEISDPDIGGLYSKYIDRSSETFDLSLYKTREEYLFALRGLLGALSSHQFTQCFTQVASPFLYKEVLDYALSIPVNKRIGHAFYKTFILNRYPEAAKYVWEKTGVKINSSKTAYFANRVIQGIHSPERVLRKLHLYKKATMTYGMNPFDLWWKTNTSLRKTYDNYFKACMSMKNDCLGKYTEAAVNMYKNASTVEKSQVITALGAWNNLFGYEAENNER